MPEPESEARWSSEVLGLTPPYLDPRCHEAVYEVDLGAMKQETSSGTWAFEQLQVERELLARQSLV
jgi:hypothetical protein